MGYELTTIYVYGDGKLISDRKTDNSQITDNNIDNNKTAVENQKGSDRYYHYDNLGSTRAITNEVGEVIAAYSYSVYGELLSGDASQTGYLYNGAYGVHTDANGLYYMRARYYNVGKAISLACKGEIAIFNEERKFRDRYMQVHQPGYSDWKPDCQPEPEPVCILPG